MGNIEKEEMAKIIGERLRALRQSKGLKFKEAAKAIGCAISTLKGWEDGYREPDISTIHLLAEFYEVEAQDLIAIPSESDPIDLNADVTQEPEAREVEYIHSDVQDAAASLGKWKDAQELADFTLWALGRLNSGTVLTGGFSGRERGEVLRERLRTMRKMWGEGIR